MISENISGDDVDYGFVTRYIPEVMNAMYNEDVAKEISLTEIRDAFRIKQMQSKAWLLSKVQEEDKNSRVIVIGSWLGFTSICLYRMGFKDIVEVDPDPRLEKFAKHLNRFNKDFIHITEDINNVDLKNFDIVINTSCEHIENNSWFDNVDTSSKLFLHSNDLEGYDHTNTCENLDEMISKYPMTLDYKGVLDFGTWRRFMVIGRKPN